MRHRHPSPPVEYQDDAAFRRSVRFKRALRLSEKDEHDRVAFEMLQLTAKERLLVELHSVQKKFPDLDSHKFGAMLAAAKNKFRQRFLAPRITRRTRDLIAAWSLPQAVALWSRWWSPEIKRAYTSAYEGSKAVMVATAGLGNSPHVSGSWDQLLESEALKSHFERLTLGTGRAHDLKATEPLAIRGYSSVMRHLGKLSAPFPLLAQETSVACARESAALNPDQPIRAVAIDGMLVEAPCQQKSGYDKDGTFNHDKDAWIRRNTPSADWIVYTYTADGMKEQATGEADTEDGQEPAKSKSISKSVRGYKFILLSEINRGRPLVGVLVPASTHETHVVKLLLDRLYALWPDIPLEVVIGDKLWDVDGVHELLAVHYGLHMVAKRQAGHRKHWRHFEEALKGKLKKGLRRPHPKIAKISGRGIPYCRAHNKPLSYQGIEWPDRAGMEPGEPFGLASAAYRARRFRARFLCQRGCGRINLACRNWWSALTKYPHHPNGRPELHAERIALEGQRNTAETAFSSLQVSFKQALRGSGRNRIESMETMEAMIWIALLTRSLLMLVDELDVATEGRRAA